MFRRIDPFISSILAAMVIGSLLPVTGGAAQWFDRGVTAAIFWLFFLYGVRISPAETRKAVLHWRLHGLVLACTFVAFPLVGWAMSQVPSSVLPAELATGLLFVALLPSTVQSSVTFTSIARGNVAAAISAASLSNVLGVLLTPLLAALFLGGVLTFSFQMLAEVAAQLLLPFVVGQLARPWLVDRLQKHPRAVTFSDKGAIVLAVYAAASHARNSGVWSQVSARDLAVLTGLLLILLGLALGGTWALGRAVGLSRADRVVLVMCGSKKSLASGVPMALVLLPASALGAVVLPIVLFHQLQLMACSVIARRWPDPEAATDPEPGR